MATTIKKKRKIFQLHAPDATAVFVVGCFNAWDQQARPLKRGANGTWKTSMTLAPGTYEYRFVVDGVWCDDPRCEEWRPNSFGSQNALLRICAISPI